MTHIGFLVFFVRISFSSSSIMFKLSTITKFFNFICLHNLRCLQSSQLTQLPVLLFSSCGRVAHRTPQYERDQSNLRNRCSRCQLWDMSSRNARSSYIWPISHRSRVLRGAHR
uniref:Putative secreted protein n=1 Tax=Anopheles marajoara TaxID=58244 RepID=A0A2M4C7U8_9DIPT